MKSGLFAETNIISWPPSALGKSHAVVRLVHYEVKTDPLAPVNSLIFRLRFAHVEKDVLLYMAFMKVTVSPISKFNLTFYDDYVNEEMDECIQR